MGVEGCLIKLNMFYVGILPKIDDCEWGYFDRCGV